MELAAPRANWDKRIAKAEKFFEKAMNHGRKVYDRYSDERENTNASYKRCNIFYSNVNTIKESLFNSLPKPEVSRLHKGDYEDDIARVASVIMQRALVYEVNCAKDFTGATKGAILDKLVPGIGQVWVRFNPDESLSIEHVFWEDFLYDPSRNWQDVTWVARKLELSRAEIEGRWGPDAVTALEQPRRGDNTPKEIHENKFCVYEIWDKRRKQVVHTAKGLDEPLEVQDDPYGLVDFFPCPRPLIANLTTKAFLPITDYHLAQDQYTQLDVLYARMGLIVEAVKVAGCYDAASPEIGRMLQGQENKLIPVDNWAMYAEQGGAKGMIDWYPVEQVVMVLQQLQASFAEIKAILYEITGMSDIVRGASNQYETAAAQEIKAQFASVRLNGYQRDVSEFVRDILGIMADLITQLYSDQKIMSIVGSLTPADVPLIPPAMQVLRSDLLRSYKINIQADSLTQSDWALEKGQRMELVGYVSQFLTSAVPAATEIPELGPLLMAMLKFSVAGFKGSAELEGILDQQLDALLTAQQQQQGQPKPPSPEEQKMQMEQQKMQMEMQMDQQRFQMEAALKQQEAEQRQQLEATQAQADMAVKQQELEHQKQINAMEIQMKQMELQFKMEEAKLKMQVDMASAQMKTEQQVVQGDLKTQQMKEQAKAKPKPTPKGD